MPMSSKHAEDITRNLSVRRRKEIFANQPPHVFLMPLQPGQLERGTHDYKRNGTTSCRRYIKVAYSAPPTDGSNGASGQGNEQKNRAKDDVSQPVTEHCQDLIFPPSAAQTSPKYQS